MKSDKSIFENYLNPYFFCILIPLKILKIMFPPNNQFQLFGFKHRKLKIPHVLKTGKPHSKMWQVYSIFARTVSDGGRKYTEMSKELWEKCITFLCFTKPCKVLFQLFLFLRGYFSVTNLLLIAVYVLLLLKGYLLKKKE